MRSAAVVTFLVCAVIGVLALLLSAATDKRDLVFTLGVNPGEPAVTLEPRQQVCQAPIEAQGSFSRVRLWVQGLDASRPRPQLAVIVRSYPAGTTIASGRTAAGPVAVSQVTAELGDVRPAGATELCVRNPGAPVALYGGKQGAAQGSGTTIDGRPNSADLAIVFERHPRSILSLVPTVFDRASLFHPGWVGSWIYWTLLVLVLAAVPALIVYALLRAGME